MPKKPSEIEQVKVRMRADQKRKLEREAERSGLTLNAEILRRLEQTLRPEDVDEVALLFRMMAQAVELERKNPDGDTPRHHGVPAGIMADAIGRLLEITFPDFRNVRISFGKPMRSLVDGTEGEQSVIITGGHGYRKLRPKMTLANLEKILEKHGRGPVPEEARKLFDKGEEK